MKQCRKLRAFSTKEAAQEAMAKLPAKATSLVPVRVFWCVQHKAYHFTSSVKPLGRRQNNGRR
jgi:hypothetical protein